MLDYIRSENLVPYVGGTVAVAGWVHRVRRLGGLTFMVVRDGGGLIQIVHQPDDAPLPSVALETVVEVVGVAVSEVRAPGGVEWRHPTIRVLSTPESPLPLYLGGPSLEAGLDLRLNEAPLKPASSGGSSYFSGSSGAGSRISPCACPSAICGSAYP